MKIIKLLTIVLVAFALPSFFINCSPIGKTNSTSIASTTHDNLPNSLPQTAPTPAPSPVNPSPLPTPAPVPQAPAPAPTPTPATSPAGYVPDFPYNKVYTSIVSNFDVNSELTPSWGTGDIPASAAPDVVGAFRFICNASHLSYDDPIVYPGQKSAAHLHQFFGNTLADANSTYDSLRRTGMSTCNSPLNRSAYWIPAMMNGKGKVVRPDYVSIYYKRYPATSPLCKSQGKDCVDLPKGLRYVFGYNMNASTQVGLGYFNCDGPTATPGHYTDIVTAAANCPLGNRLGAIISSPSCWDGVNLDSADHRSHMAYQSYDPNDGQPKCPASHPHIIPTFTLGAWYATDSDLDRSGVFDPAKPSWHLSSDRMVGKPVYKSGQTLHADWFGAWDDTVLKMWHDNCINKLLNCSGGDLGNGKQLKLFNGFSWVANPHLVDPPAK